MLRSILALVAAMFTGGVGAYVLTSSGWSDAVSLIVPIVCAIIVFLLIEHDQCPVCEGSGRVYMGLINQEVTCLTCSGSGVKS